MKGKEIEGMHLIADKTKMTNVAWMKSKTGYAIIIIYKTWYHLNCRTRPTGSCRVKLHDSILAVYSPTTGSGVHGQWKSFDLKTTWNRNGMFPVIRWRYEWVVNDSLWLCNAILVAQVMIYKLRALNYFHCLLWLSKTWVYRIANHDQTFKLTLLT